MGLTLIISLAFAISSALQAGWNIGVTNLPEVYIKCWIDIAKFNTNISSTDWANVCSDPNNMPDLTEATKFWSLCVSIFAVGAMFGSFMGAPLADYLGRKWGLFTNAIFGIISVIICACCRKSDNVYLFLAGRILVGINAGINCSIAPVYNIEIAPLNQRGRFGTLFQLGVTGGSVLSNIFGLKWLLGTNDLWPYLILLGMFPSVLQIVLVVLVPESPLYLDNLKKYDDADKNRIKLYGANYKDDPNIVINQHMKLNDEVNEDDDDEIRPPKRLGVIDSLKAIFTENGLRNAIVCSSILMIIQQFCGINAIVFYSTSIFEEAGIDSEWSGLTTVGLGIFKWSFLWVALWLIEKSGRRFLMLAGCAMMCIMCVATTVLLHFLDTEGESEDSNGVLAYISIVPVFIYVMGFELGPGPIPWMITNEFVPSTYKAGGQAVCSFVNWTGAFIIGLIFEPLQEAISEYVFLIFGVVCAVGFVYIYFRMPETKGRPIDEIQRDFEERTSCL